MSDTTTPPGAERLPQLAALIEQTIGVPAAIISARSRFSEDLSADSLDLIEITMKAEEAFGIDLDDRQLPPSEDATVADLLALIEQKLAARAEG